MQCFDYQNIPNKKGRRKQQFVITMLKNMNKTIICINTFNFSTYFQTIRMVGASSVSLSHVVTYLAFFTKKE